MLTTPGGDSNLDNIIKKNFFTEIQQRRVKTEIQYLKELDQNCFKVSLQSTPIGLKILVSITKNFILKEIKEAEKFVFPIVFEFLLEPKFPFVFPKLLCKTSFFTPNLADGRDFVEDVIQRMWNPSILLRDVVVYIPDFLKRLIQLTIPEESQLLGKYYLGHLYNLEDFLTMDTAHVFPGTEMINEQSVNNERYFIIIESFFLNFESVDKARNTLRLISWAHVQAVSRIKRNKDDPKMLVFLWHDNDKKGVLVQNVFITDQAIEMVETIVRMGQKYAKVTETIKKQRDLPLAEVTAKNYRDMDIEELLENIAMLESKLEAEPTISEINLLMTLYQKAVEYFSALNDPAYSEFVEKLHDLLTREDIQVILKSGEGNQAGQGKKGSASKKLREKPKASPAKGEVGVPDQFREPEESRHTPSREPKKRATPQKKEEPAIKKEEQQPVVEVQHHVPVQENKQKPNEEQIVVSADTEAEKAAEAVIEKKEEKQEEQQELKLEERHEEKPEEQPEKQEEQKEEQQEVKQEEKPEEQQEEQQEAKQEEKQEEQQEVQEEKQQEVKPEEKQEEQQAEVQEEKQEEKQEEQREEQQEEKQNEEEKVEPAESNKVEEEKAEEKPEEAEKPEEVEVEQPKAEEPAPVEVNHQEEQEKDKEPEPEKEKEKEKEEEKEEETTKHTNNEEHTKPMDNFIPPANDDMFDIGDDDD